MITAFHHDDGAVTYTIGDPDDGHGLLSRWRVNKGDLSRSSTLRVWLAAQGLVPVGEDDLSFRAVWYGRRAAWPVHWLRLWWSEHCWRGLLWLLRAGLIADNPDRFGTEPTARQLLRSFTLNPIEWGRRQGRPYRN